VLLRHRDRLPVLPLEVAPADDPVQVEVGPGAHVVADRARGGTMDWQAAWRVVIRNLPGLLVTSIFVFVGVVIGLMLCIVPGIVFGLLCAFTVPVILLEKKSGTGAIQRSIELVRADWLRVAIVLIVFGILKAVASWLGGLLVPARSIFLHEFIGDLISIAVLPNPDHRTRATLPGHRPLADERHGRPAGSTAGRIARPPRGHAAGEAKTRFPCGFLALGDSAGGRAYSK
jgi:hypothetical protein